VEKSWGSNDARIGLGLSSDFSGRAFFNVLGQYRRTWLNDLGGEWRTDVAMGRNTSLDTEFYQPLEPRHRFFVVPQLHAERYYLPLLEGLYAGVSAEVGEYGKALLAGNPSGALYSGSAFLALDSPIGPVYLGFGIGLQGNRSAYLFLGRP
jgi:NTE family protein